MSLGARPMDVEAIRAVFDRKMAEFSHVAPGVAIRHLDPERFFEAVLADPDIAFAVDSGFIVNIEDELRDPVVLLDGRHLFTCPELAVRVLHPEPPEIHRPFTEGVFFRKLFRLFVPATQEGGAAWEAAEQVRDIMRRHFAFQLVVTESVLGQAA
jgi:hypothetical protein